MCGAGDVPGGFGPNQRQKVAIDKPRGELLVYKPGDSKLGSVMCLLTVQCAVKITGTTKQTRKKKSKRGTR